MLFILLREPRKSQSELSVMIGVCPQIPSDQPKLPDYENLKVQYIKLIIKSVIKSVIKFKM